MIIGFNGWGAQTIRQTFSASLIVAAVVLCLTALAEAAQPSQEAKWTHVGPLQVQRDIAVIQTNYPPGAAENALRELRDAGPDAMDAEPILSTVLADGRRSSLQRRIAAEALGNLAQCNEATNSFSALNSLVQALGTEDDNVAAQAAISVGCQRVVDRTVVSALAARVRDEAAGRVVRREAVRALGNLAQFPKISLPALAQIIQTHVGEVDGAEEATTAIQRFGVRASSEIPMLSNLLQDSGTHLGLRDNAAAALREIVGCVGKQSRDLRTTELVTTWLRLHAAKQQLLNADADSQGTAKSAIDQSLICLRAEAKRRGLLAAAYFGFTEAAFATISVVFIVFFPTQAKRLNKLIGQIETGPKLTVPIVSLEIRIPEIQIGKILQFIFILGVLVKLASRFNWRLREWGENNKNTETNTYSI